MRCGTQSVRLIFNGYTSSTANAVPLPLKGNAKRSRRLSVEKPDKELYSKKIVDERSTAL